MAGKVLIAGASGVVGLAAAKHFAALPDWEVVGLARRPPGGLEGVELLAVDLTDAAAEPGRALRLRRRHPRGLRRALREARTAARVVRARPDGDQPADAAQPPRPAPGRGRRPGARLAAPRDQGLRRPRRADGRAGSGAQPAPRARELLLAAGGRPPRATGGERVGLHHPAAAGDLRRVARQQHEPHPRAGHVRRHAAPGRPATQLPGRRALHRRGRGCRPAGPRPALGRDHARLPQRDLQHHQRRRVHDAQRVAGPGRCLRHGGGRRRADVAGQRDAGAPGRTGRRWWSGSGCGRPSSSTPSWASRSSTPT